MIKKALMLQTVLLSMTAVAETTFTVAEPVVMGETPHAMSPSVAQAWQETNASDIPSYHVPLMAEGLDVRRIEDFIAYALQSRQWQSLGQLLTEYEALPNHDVILVHYAKGAMLRARGEQKQAIAHYRQILDKASDLPYVRLDLALMLFEDKQYKEAAALMERLLVEDIAEPAKVVLRDALNTMQKQQAWQPTLNVNYERTDNVNNASSEREIVWLGRRWQKQADSLPKEAHGVRYGAGLDKETNVSGNHYVGFDVSVDGVQYFDVDGYDELNTRLSAGYKYQDLKRTWRVSPFFEKGWLDDEAYSRSVGVSGGYGQGVGAKTYWQLNANYAQKFYEDGRQAENYDSTLASLGLSVSRRINRQVLIFGGVDVGLDDTNNPEYASKRHGLRMGVVRDVSGGLGMSASLRYAKRRFDAPESLVYRFVREDDEYQAAFNLWHDKFSWRGLRPELNLRYVNIDSNMPAFYSRDGVSYYMSLGKKF
ncbi:MAG: surface lipoprotein assembly modifier [Moraxella sp.]|nr:surface lipoprotein assembly modifier [Moraxella sp.]